MPIYGKKPLKNFLLQNRGCLGAKYLHKSSGTGDLPKLLKWLSYFNIWLFYIKLMFASLCICMSPIHLYGTIVENFKLLLWSRWDRFSQNFIWSLHRSKEWKISEMVAAGWPRWPSCPYMVKNIKNLLLQYLGCHAEFLHKLSEMRDLPKLLKWLSYVDVWPLYGKVMFGSLCIYMSLVHLYGKIVENFKWLLLWSSWANYAQILYGASLGRGQLKIAKMVAVHWPRWLPCPYMVKKPLKIFFSRAFGLNLCTDHLGRAVFQNC